MNNIEELRAAKEKWKEWAGGAHWHRGVGITRSDGELILSIRVAPGYLEEADRVVKACGITVPYQIEEMEMPVAR